MMTTTTAITESVDTGEDKDGLSDLLTKSCAKSNGLIQPVLVTSRGM